MQRSYTIRVAGDGDTDLSQLVRVTIWSYVML